MHRRAFLKAGSASLGVLGLSIGTATRASAAVPSFRIRAGSTVTRWSALEQDHHSGGQFPPGAGDGPVSFVKAADGNLIVFQMHGNGHTYRHVGRTLDSLSPGVWVHGPNGTGDNAHYSGINSVLRSTRSRRLYGWIHQERIGPDGHVASIGFAQSDDEGYSWQYRGTILTGDALQPTGFRGAESPSVVRNGNTFVMLYGNRYGDGRHQQIWSATAPMNADGSPGTWTKRGEVISEGGAGPHFYAASPCLRWSTAQRQWLCAYSTDKAFRFRSSRDLRQWSDPVTFVEKSQQYTQTTGWYRYYPTLLDPSKQDSSQIGSSGWVSEHRISVTDGNDRFPALFTFRT
ncbi:MAG: hypothetical protein AB7Q27_12190 [Acidimicrobiia bacterium]